MEFTIQIRDVEYLVSDTKHIPSGTEAIFEMYEPSFGVSYYMLGLFREIKEKSKIKNVFYIVKSQHLSESWGI